MGPVQARKLGSGIDRLDTQIIRDTDEAGTYHTVFRVSAVTAEVD